MQDKPTKITVSASWTAVARQSICVLAIRRVSDANPLFIELCKD